MNILTSIDIAIEIGERSNKNICIHYQLKPEVLVEQILERNEGVLNNTGAICIETGVFTGRSPKDRFIVKDALTKDSIDWNNFNLPIDERHFLQLRTRMIDYLAGKKEIWMRDAYVCAVDPYRLNIRVINEDCRSNLFAYNMFLRPGKNTPEKTEPGWYIIQAPGFKADPLSDGTRQENFVIVSFNHKTILIGGTAYTGEMKKSIFSVLNFLLPYRQNVLSMHCSANMGEEGDVAIFFGLSGTGKTTLSADPGRTLIGDDEHGWTNDSVFNFEGGCYAKCIGLTESKEPEIFRAIRPGALVENVYFFAGTNTIDFNSAIITENTRVSYPLSFISNASETGIGNAPKNIFFLTCDAYGVLPPISKLTPEQSMYHFISGYTAKVAGTETGITEPTATFSACFGAPFLPLHPGFYAEMLGNKIKEQEVNVWLINTGWIGGGYGVGERIKLSYTRAMITAALNGSLKNVETEIDPVFGLHIPVSCADMPREILHPRLLWPDKTAYDIAAKKLAIQFVENFETYAHSVDPQLLAAGPHL